MLIENKTIGVFLINFRYSWDDQEFKFFEDSFEYFRKNTSTLFITDRIPILELIYFNKMNKVRKVLMDLSLTIRSKYHERLQDHQKGIIRDFCDALIEAKEEAINEEKESAPHLNDNNLSLVILNLFFGKFDRK